MMLCFGNMKIAHATLHQSVRQALEAITRERVTRVIQATARALQRMGIAAPKIAVSGLNPHAGEGGLFGARGDRDHQAGDRCRRWRTASPSPARSAPTPCFTCRASTPSSSCCTTRATSPPSCWRENAAAALAIGTPILFSSVAHGSAHDIAGKGVADPKAMIEAVLRMAGARRRKTEL